ncbi:MAG: hypothetical protein ACOVN0_03465 [Niveispirillum sp.]|uniref:hypothetical protein n=1 Tax=Niveispirillum sp. TaxID=1917217 RepID=UPI003BA773E6
MNNVVLRLVGILLGFLGLFLAAGARDPGMFLGGLLFCFFGVALNFWLIAQDYPHHPQGV